MCSSTSCGAFVLQSLGTSLECLSLSQAGVAVLSSQLFSANVYVCVCLCTFVFGSVHEQYVCKQGLPTRSLADAASVALARRIVVMSNNLYVILLHVTLIVAAENVIELSICTSNAGG